MQGLALLGTIAFIFLFLFLTFAGLLFRSRSATEALQERLSREAKREPAGTPIDPLALEEAPFVRANRWQKRLTRGNWGKQIEKTLMQADLKWRVSEFLAFSLLLSVIFYIIGSQIKLMPGLNLFTAVIGLFILWIYVVRRKKSRLQKINGQLVETLEIITSALKSGHSFLQALESAHHDMGPPIKSELEKTLQEMSLGISTEEAMERLYNRLEDKDLDLVITAVSIQRRVGGNLSEVLTNIAHTMRERIRIRGEIKTLTTNARASAWVLSLLPISMAGFLTLINPNYMGPLFTEPLGRILVATGLTMQVIGVLLLQRIANIKV